MTSRMNLLIFVLLSTFSYTQTNYARFPGKRSELPSPDGHYVLVNVDSDREPYHSIILKEKSTSTMRKISDYGRSATVVWAPDSRHFALNDYAGSDFTNTHIIAVDESVPRIDIQMEILAHVRRLAGGDHEYFGVVRWLDNRHVIVHHWGHGESQQRAFCECHIYTLNGSVEKCANQPRSSDPEERCQELTP